MLWIKENKIIHYNSGIDLMNTKLHQVIDKKEPDTFLLFEHDDVYTAGSSATESELIDSSIFPIRTNRGGKITYHGPGQRVIYPILSLEPMRDVKRYISFLEAWIIKALKAIKIEGFRDKDLPGVWSSLGAHKAKIAFIGIRVKKWVTYHGIAINVNSDLSKYHPIMPCGIQDCKVASINSLGIKIDIHEFDEILKTTLDHVRL